MPDKMAFFVRAGQPTGTQEALISAKMAEACGYRQHDQLVNALKFGHKRKSSQAQETSKTSSASDEVIKELQNHVAVLTDLVKSNMAVKEVPNTGAKREYNDKSRFECRKCRGLGHFQGSCNWNG